MHLGGTMGLDFTAVDFETANEQRGSVCAVGVTTVRDGAVVATQSWLVRPPGELRFTNSRIHGITANHVTHAASWGGSLERIDALTGDTHLVAYNSPFDKGVYAAASRLSGMEPSPRVWRDVRVLAKAHLTLESYRLVDVSRELGLRDFEHHDAGADAEACARVALAIAAARGCLTVEELWRVPTSAAKSPSSGYRQHTPLPTTNSAADPGHPLFGASITFTGDLLGFSRPEARAAAAALGAIVTGSPTRKTDVVVVGGFDPATFRPGAEVSLKVQKAIDLRSAGQRIELISEDDFVALLAYEPDARVG